LVREESTGPVLALDFPAKPVTVSDSGLAERMAKAVGIPMEKVIFAGTNNMDLLLEVDPSIDVELFNVNVGSVVSTPLHTLSLHTDLMITYAHNSLYVCVCV
jgi:hypothetical protein